MEIRSRIGRLARLSFFFLLTLAFSACSGQAQAQTRDEIVFFFNDAQGSAVAAVNESGELCWHENYSPYGEKSVGDDVFSTEGCGIVGEERGFTSHTVDYDTDLTYMQQRYYDPTIGRFLSTDPVGPVVWDPRTINRYAYAYNNPNRYVDPDGRWAEDIFIGVPSVGFGIYSLVNNALGGNWVDVGIDAAGIVADLGAIATPGVPGGVGFGIKAGRSADKLNDTVSIFKAPVSGKGKSQFENGYDPKDFCDGDQCAYFAKEKSLADEYAKNYGDGVIELKIPKDVYDSRMKPHEYSYQGGPQTEIVVPHSEFDVLNSAERNWHK